jgi:F-type H+-transporting ATPase subunit delta
MAQASHTFDPALEHIGSVYSKALLAATEKSSESEQVVQELEEIVSEVFDQRPQLVPVLASLRLVHEERTTMLDRAFGGRVSPTTLNFLKVLSSHGRLGMLRSVASAARKLLDAKRNRIEVQVRTAAPLSNPLRDQITTRLASMLGKEVVLVTKVDPELLGGVVVKVGDTLYDGSVANRLVAMRSQAIEQTTARFRDSQNKFVTT